MIIKLITFVYLLYQLSQLSNDEHGVFLSYREVSLLDMMKEIRQRIQIKKGNDDEVGIKREIKAFPLCLQALNQDNNMVVLVMTTEGLLLIDHVSTLVGNT